MISRILSGKHSKSYWFKKRNIAVSILLRDEYNSAIWLPPIPGSRR